MPVSLTFGLSLTGTRNLASNAPLSPVNDDMLSALAVAADGWTLDATLLGSVAGGSYSGLNDFSTPGGKLIVTRKTPTPASPTATTDFDVPLTSVKRKPYPDGASLQETASGSDLDTAFSLASFIYANEDVSALFEAGFFTDDGAGGSDAANSGGAASVTNNSALDYPVPIMAWLTPPMQRIDAADWAPHLVVDHWYARNGRPVYAVVFTATDEHSNTVSATVTTLTTVTFGTTGKAIGVLQPDWDLSGLTDGDVVTINATIYPWIGDVFDIATDAFAYPSPNITVLKAVCDAGGTYGTVYAYVDGVGAGTPAASTNKATAAASPFATIIAAATAAIALNNSAHGRNNMSGVEVYIPASTVITDFGGNTLDSLAEGDLPLIIKGDARASSVYQHNAASTNNDIPSAIQFENLIFRKNGGSIIALDGKNTTSAFVVCIDVDFDLNGNTSYENGWFYRVGLEYFINCGGDYCGQGAGSVANVQSTAMVAGCPWIPKYPYNAVCCDFTGTLGFTGNASLGLPQGMVLMNNFIKDPTDSPAALPLNSYDLGIWGLSLTGSIFEQYGAVAGSYLIALSDASDDATPYQNVVAHGLGGYGGRTNLLYNWYDGVAVVKRGVFDHSVFQYFNSKTDYATVENGARTGNWAFRHGVDCFNNYVELGSSNGDSTPGYDSWIGEALGDGKNEFPNGWIIGGSPLYADDKTGVAGTGGGDYEPGALSAIPALPAGAAWSSVDLLGTAIPNDGSGVAGPVQRTA